MYTDDTYYNPLKYRIKSNLTNCACFKDRGKCKLIVKKKEVYKNYKVRKINKVKLCYKYVNSFFLAESQ